MFSKQNPTILAIDTSFDETAAAISRGSHLLSNIRHTQMEHSVYGGGVPHIAKLEHQRKIDGVINQALVEAGIERSDVDLIAVTYGPGLAIALEVGIAKAKDLAREWKVPVMGINHMEGHLLSGMGADEIEGATSASRLHNKLPAIALLVSGGHTELVLVKGVNEYKVIGETGDDAAGEAYDKCGRMLGLEYPAGLAVSKLADQFGQRIRTKVLKTAQRTYLQGFDAQTNELKYELPIPMAASHDLRMSYSGIKTAFKQLVQEVRSANREEGLTTEQQGELAFMLNETINLSLVFKLELAIEIYSPKEIWIGGGVASNKQLQEKVKLLCEKMNVSLKIPDSINLLVDNAGMIAIAAGLKIAKYQEEGATEVPMLFEESEFEKLDRDPSLTL